VLSDTRQGTRGQAMLQALQGTAELGQLRTGRQESVINNRLTSSRRGVAMEVQTGAGISEAARNTGSQVAGTSNQHPPAGITQVRFLVACSTKAFSSFYIISETC
jgi:hypothetical protein